jgi:hypothetical protein
MAAIVTPSAFSICAPTADPLFGNQPMTIEEWKNKFIPGYTIVCNEETCTLKPSDNSPGKCTVQFQTNVDPDLTKGYCAIPESPYYRIQACYLACLAKGKQDFRACRDEMKTWIVSADDNFKCPY